VAGLIELADTSAWTNQHKDPDVSAEFRGSVRAGVIVTCNIVNLELLYSSQDARDFRERREDLEALASFPIDRTVWQRATDVFELLASQGPPHHRRVALPDLLVAATAEVAGVPVCHYDRDFEVIAALTGQPVRAIAPLGSLD